MTEYRLLTLTSPPIQGDNVKAFQNVLTHRGYFNGPIDGVYGVLTAQAVYRAKFRLGYLHPDHRAGDLLYAYLTGAKRPTLQMALTAKSRIPKPIAKTHGALTLAYAEKFIGVKENPAGSNLQQFGAWYGINGEPWCNMFVTYCYVLGAKSTAFQRGSRYAYVPYMDADARAGRNHLTIATTVLPGDVITFDWNKDGTPDHTGLFVDWIDKTAGSFKSIEGNTGVGNNSNGGEVMLRSDRIKSEVRTFIRVGA